MRIGDRMQSYRDEIVHHIQELVRIRSVTEPAQPGMPFGGGIDKALRYMLDLAESFGFSVVNVDGYAGHAEYGSGDDLVSVLVHLDTVHEGEGWTYPPFGGEIHDDRIYGRGASDNKGPAVVALFALKALKDSGLEPAKRIRLVFGTDEESGMKDMDYYFSKEPLPDMAFAPDAGYPIFNVEMGNTTVIFSQPENVPETDKNADVRLPILSLQGGNTRTLIPGSCTAVVSLDLLTESEIGDLSALAGSSANITAERLPNGTMNLSAGNVPADNHATGSANAVANMVAFLRGIPWKTNREALLAFLHERIGLETNGESLGIACKDEASGGLAVFLRLANWERAENETNCNIRYPVTHDGERILDSVRDAAGRYGLDMRVSRHLKPVYVDPGHPVIVRLSRAYEAITGKPAELLRMGAGTYCRKLNNNGVAFGAGLPGGVNTNVHQADEFVSIDDMMEHAVLCLQGLYELAFDQVIGQSD